jgi:hypothetical protein
MTPFDDLLDSATEDLTDPDVVGLAGYYLREVEDDYPFTTKQIREVVGPSLRAIPKESLSAYPSQLKDKNHFQRRDDKWDLTGEGLEYYSDLVEVPTSTDMPRNDDDLFISTTPPEDEFYSPLVEDINQSYQHHIYDATMILTRKLFENLLIEVLRLRLGTNDHLDTFFIPDQGRFQPFSQLIENFSEELDEFKPYDPDIDATFVNQLDKFRTRANANAHSIQVDLSKGEIEALSDDANALAKRLFRLREQAKLDADRSD